MVAVLSGFTPIDGDPVDKIIEQISKWFWDNPAEKVYLQTDKPYYAIGDDIWFKAYITLGSDHRLSTLSGVLNVELIDDKDSVKQSIKLPVVNGLTWGDFVLSDSLKEGNYRIRAYTNWMRNAGAEYYYDKTFSVVNAVKNNVFTKTAYTFGTQNNQQKVNALINYTDINGMPYAAKPVSYEVEIGPKTILKGRGVTDVKGDLTIAFVNTQSGPFKSGRIITNIKTSEKKIETKYVTIKAVSDKVDVQFFPEGGNLVNGNYSKIAFKAVGADGQGTEIKGTVTDNQNNQVCTFSSTHLGMGIFSFIPENGKSYKAKITYADGSQNIVDLPAASDAGYSLSVGNSGKDSILIKINPGRIVLNNIDETQILGLIGQSGGTIYYAAKTKPGSKFFITKVAKSKFPSGIVQFTLFSATAEPLNERLVFIQNDEGLKMDISTEKQTYARREKVKIDFWVKDKNGVPEIGSFSAAVTDETKVPVDEASETTIFSHFLLSSDIKGFVEKPNYYFVAPNQKTEADLDVLMLTQGYHRFEWKKLLNDSYPAIEYPAEKTLEISGHLKTPWGKPVVNGKVMLMTTSGQIFLIDTVTDNNGLFCFRNLLFKDSVKFVIQGRTAKDRKNLLITLDNLPVEYAGINKNSAELQVNINEGQASFLQNSKMYYDGLVKYGVIKPTIMLNEVVIKAKKATVEQSENLNGPGNADQVIFGSDLMAVCARLTDCLQGRLFGVIFRNDTAYLIRGGGPMLIVIDGSYADAGFLNDLNGSDIQSIEILKNIEYTSIYGSRGSGGVLIVTTKRGTGGAFYKRDAPGIITYMPKGYYKARTFYSPQYDVAGTNAMATDLRSTVFWKPNLVTDDDGKASFSYFNTDNKGSYRVVIEGIDANGNLGRKVFHYKVE